jgi:hypothetical protein
MLHIRILLICLAAIAPTVLAGSTSAQVPDFDSQIQPTLTANELLVRQIVEAMPAVDMATLSQGSELSLNLGEQLQQQLNQALTLAPDDATRSRIEGVLTHTQAATASLQQAQVETTLDAARGRLDQARGEAQEGLDELRPFVVALPRPAELPVAGSLGPPVATLPVIGVVLMVIGLALRITSRHVW